MQRVSPFLLSASVSPTPPTLPPPACPACVSRIAVAVVQHFCNSCANEKHFKFNTHECMHGRTLMSPDELRAGGTMGGKGMEVNGTSGGERGREGAGGGGGGEGRGGACLHRVDLKLNNHALTS